jgi:nicotinamide-nucleotide amidase
MPSEYFGVATALIRLCAERKLTIATAESCTGGLVAGALTEVPGSSAVLDRGFVTYSNAAKQQMLGVPMATLKQYGEVSRQTAEAMARGVLAKCNVDLAVSITGIAGPGGGSTDKPVGLVHFAAESRDGTTMTTARRYGDVGRAEVRRLSVLQALTMLLELVEGGGPEKPRKKISKRLRPPVIEPLVIKPWPDKERG